MHASCCILKRTAARSLPLAAAARLSLTTRPYLAKHVAPDISAATLVTTAAAMSSSSKQHCYAWPRPAVTVDVVVWALEPEAAHVLLITRKHAPFADARALPGGFVDQQEDLAVAAARELQEETGVEDLALLQVGAFGKPHRDPRGHTVSAAYHAVLASRAERHVAAADDAASAEWVDLASLASMDFAFDHQELLLCSARLLAQQLAIAAHCADVPQLASLSAGLPSDVQEHASQHLAHVQALLDAWRDTPGAALPIGQTSTSAAR